MKVYIKIEKTIIKFDDIKIPKQNFYRHKRPISIKNVDIDKIVASKVPLGNRRFKCFIGYEDAKKIIPLCAFLPKITAYRKDFDETKYVSFFIKDGKGLEKYKFEIKSGIKSVILSEKNLIVIRYTMKNI